MFIITVLYDRSVKLPDISFEDCENMNSQIRKDAREGPQLYCNLIHQNLLVASIVS